jgi:hypothetical protein
VLSCIAGAAFGQSPAPTQPPIEIELEYAYSELPRRVGLYTALGEAANRGADLGLDKLFGDGKRGRSRVALRIARLWLVNLPIAALTTAVSHNAGHFARMNEVERGDHVLHVTQWPWPIPIVGTVEWGTSRIDTPMQQMSVVGGGEQGSGVLKERVVDKIYASDRADYFDWVLAGYAALDFPAYAWTDLRPSHFSSLDRFWSSNPADFRNYVAAEQEMAQQMADDDVVPNGEGLFIRSVALELRDLSRFARQIRRSAWLNLADYTVWSAFRRTVQYAATGERSTINPALAVGPLRIVPGAYATLGTVGLERGVDVRVLGSRSLTHVNVRHTSPPTGGSRWGFGIGLRSRTATAIQPEGQIDAWQRPEHRTGFRVEAGLRGPLGHGSQPFETAFRVGYKTEGYLTDAPYRATLLASISTTIRF